MTAQPSTGAGWQLRERVVNAVVSGVKETFLGMLKMVVTNKPPVFRMDPMAFSGISVIIGIVGKVTGSLSIHCSDQAATALTSRLMKTEIKMMGPEVQDALAEIVNVFAGVSKRKASEEKSIFDLSVPTIITGVGHNVTPWIRWPSTVVEFDFGDGTFTVVVFLRGL